MKRKISQIFISVGGLRPRKSQCEELSVILIFMQNPLENSIKLWKVTKFLPFYRTNCDQLFYKFRPWGTATPQIPFFAFLLSSLLLPYSHWNLSGKKCIFSSVSMSLQILINLSEYCWKIAQKCRALPNSKFSLRPSKIGHQPFGGPLEKSFINIEYSFSIFCLILHFLKFVTICGDVLTSSTYKPLWKYASFPKKHLGGAASRKRKSSKFWGNPY